MLVQGRQVVGAESHFRVQRLRGYGGLGLARYDPDNGQDFEAQKNLWLADALEKLSFIKNCRTLDLTLCEIKQLISLRTAPDAPCEGVNAMIDGHLHAVQHRIADLQNLFDELKRLRLRCGHARTVDQCGILDALSLKS